MAVTQIIPKISLGTWVSTSLSNKHFCYLTAKKNTSVEGDTIDSSKVRLITLAIGADSGVQNHPIIVQRVTLSYNDAQYGDPEIDDKVAFARLLNLPDTFYIKVLSVDDGQKEYTSGDVAISISTEGISLI